MSDHVPRRRLAALLAADVVGYSRLLQADEAGTLAALKGRRGDILQPLIAKHHGRIVKLIGDGVLVEFASAADAVECAVQLQQAMDTANRDIPTNMSGDPEQEYFADGLTEDIIAEPSRAVSRACR